MSSSAKEQTRCRLFNRRRMVLAAIAVVSGACLITYGFISSRTSGLPWVGFQAPDEIRAGREMLASRFTGPGYFHHPDGSEAASFPHVSVAEARRQMAPVAAARRLSGGDFEKLTKLISALAEPPSSRMVGESRIDVFQLNLALDEMNPSGRTGETKSP